MPEEKTSKRLLVIDGNALVHRAYHALPPLKTKKGELVNAVFGFYSIFLKAVKELKPDFIAACFDLKGPTFRHKAFKEYKAKRPKAPEELYQQIDGVKKILSAFEVPVFEKEGFEADDLIGTVALQAKRKQAFPKIETVILSGDLDTLQLVDEQTKVYTMKKGIRDTVLYDVERVKERYEGLTPEQLLDFKALRGDPSDNIPGVTGIGEKTAIGLLRAFGTLEELYQEVERNSEKASQIKAGVLQKLKNYKEQAFISKKLAEINRTVPLNFQLKDCEFGKYDKTKIERAFQEFEFYSLIERLPGAEKEQRKTGQAGLFGGESRENGIVKEIEMLKVQGVLSEKLAEMEKALVPLVKRMEKNGIKVDIKSLNEFSVSLGEKIEKLQTEIYKVAGSEFNLNSPRQLSEVLFVGLGIGQKGLKKTPGGVVSTNAQELEKLRNVHPIINLILEYRELFKLKSGFVDSLPKVISPKDGRIHPHFHQLGAETGRMSCSEPNLQNIPIKSDLSRAIRKFFVPEKDFKFLSADYSQTELRIAASLSGDKKMLGFFKDGKDVHQLTAKALGATREIAKSLNYAVLYGMGPYGFSARTGLPLEQARDFIETYLSDFRGIAEYLEKAVEETREKGFSQTLFGRKRLLPEINSRDPRLKAQAERMARNFPIQGTAADIMKMTMLELQRQKIFNDDCRLLLQIHDELLFEVKKDKIEEAASKIKETMERIAVLKIPLKVEMKAGESWGELELLQEVDQTKIN